MLITFSGLDGSGKSTLVDYLKESLQKEDRNVAVSHMNYDVGLYSALRYLLKHIRPEKNGRASHAPREQAYDGKFRSRAARLRYNLVWNKGLRTLIYPVDIAIFVCYRFYVEKVNRQVLIMDRYFYDTLVDVTGASRSLRFRFLAWLTPTPTLPVYLDITPERAFERKAEYSVDYLKRRRLSYQKLLVALPDILVLSTNHDLNTTRSHIETVVRERLDEVGIGSHARGFAAAGAERLRLSVQLSNPPAASLSLAASRSQCDPERRSLSAPNAAKPPSVGDGASKWT